MAMNENQEYFWHFVSTRSRDFAPRLAYNDEREIKLGETITMPSYVTPQLCRQGLHACYKPLDCYEYASDYYASTRDKWTPGIWFCKVRLGEERSTQKSPGWPQDEEKLCSTERTVVAWITPEKTHEFHRRLLAFAFLRLVQRWSHYTEKLLRYETPEDRERILEDQEVLVRYLTVIRDNPRGAYNDIPLRRNTGFVEYIDAWHRHDALSWSEDYPGVRYLEKCLLHDVALHSWQVMNIINMIKDRVDFYEGEPADDSNQALLTDEMNEKFVELFEEYAEYAEDLEE